MVAPNGLDYTEHKFDTYAYVDPLKLNLTGKSVFITGASKGIGSAIAKSFAKAGASTIGIGARGSTDESVKAIKAGAVDAKRAEPKILTYVLDVTDPTSVATAAKQFLTDSGGRLDILINNAGYLSSFTPIADSDPMEWWMNFEVNVKGIYLVTKHFLPIVLSDSKSDRTIVNVTSAGAHTITNGGSGYQTSKFAQLRFTEFIGAEYGEKGVLSYIVHPGGVPTEMGQRFSLDTGRAMEDSPEICADTLTFLTSEKRDWLQGRYLNCPWDMEQVMKRKDDIVQNDYFKTRMKVGMPGQ